MVTPVKKPPAEVTQELEAAFAEDKANKTDHIGSAFSALLREEGRSPDASVFAMTESTADEKIKALTPAQRCKLLDKTKGRTCYRDVVGFVAAADKKVVEPRKTEVAATLNTSYQFDSNARTAKRNAVEDMYINTSPSVKLTVPLPQESEFVASVFTAYSRYDSLSDIDSDTLQATLAYGRTLSSVDQTPGSATKRTEVVAIRAVGTGNYQPGFSGAGSRYYSPALLWDLKGIAVNDALCGKPKAKVNCWVAGVSVELGQTWFGSEGKNKNARAGLTGSLEWNIRGKELVWGVSGGVTNRYYEDYPGDRNDVFFAGSTSITWSPSANLTLAASAEYRNQTSNQDAVEYNKYVLFPKATARMSF